MGTRRWLYQVVLALVVSSVLTNSSFAQTPGLRSEDANAPVTGLLQWQKDGVPLVTALGNQRAPQIVTDGAGGGIVVWLDYRPFWTPGAPAHLYAQRVSATGQTLWRHDGVPIMVVGDQWELQVVSDGEGGAIVVWSDSRSGRSHIYAQRLNENGVLLWAEAGLQLSAAIGNQANPVLASDGTGGAFVAWGDYGDNQDGSRMVRVQHMLGDGSFAWGAEGVRVEVNAREEFDPQIMPDGAGGVIVAWRGSCTIAWQGLCVQRLDRNGSRIWGQYGVLISVAPATNAKSQLLANAGGGATIVWVDRRHLNDDVYAQRVSGDGTAQWASGGAPVIVAPGDQALPRLVNDGRDGSIVSWYDARLTENGIYVQHLDAAGQPTWDPKRTPIGHVEVTDALDRPDAMSPTIIELGAFYDIVPDGAEGAVITWWGAMTRGSQMTSGVWLQRVVADGAAVWPGGGVLVQESIYGLGGTHLLNDSVGGAIIVWEDNRRWYKTDEYDVYAQRVVEGSYHTYLPWVAR